MPKILDDLLGAPYRLSAAAWVLGCPSVDVPAQPSKLKGCLPRSTSPQGVAQSRNAALQRVKGMGIFKIFLVCDGHDDCLSQ